MNVEQTVLLVAFGLCAFLALAGALGMATTMSMFRSGIFLMTSFIGVGGLFILLAADLMGLLQIMMYIGGMLVMILFMVLFMHDPGGAAMAAMPTMMSPVERFFSAGLQEEPGQDKEQHHNAGMDGHERADHRAIHRGEMDHGKINRGDTAGDHGMHGAMDRENMDQGEMDQGEVDHSGMDQGNNHDRSGVNGTMPGKKHEKTEHMAAPGKDREDPRHTGTQHGSVQSGDMEKMGDMDDMGPMGGMDMSMVTPVRPLAAWGAAAIGACLVVLLLLRPTWPAVRQHPDSDSARAIGMLLMHKYMIAFEGAGFVILLGIFGAVFLARTDWHAKAAGRAMPVARAEGPPPAESDPATAGSHGERS